MNFNESCHLGLGYVRPCVVTWARVRHHLLMAIRRTFTGILFRQFSELKKWPDFGLR